MTAIDWFVIVFSIAYGYVMLFTGQTFDATLDCFRVPMDEEPYEEI